MPDPTLEASPSSTPWWHDPNRVSLTALAGLLAILVLLIVPWTAGGSRAAPGQRLAMVDPQPCGQPGHATCTTAALRVSAIGLTVSDMERSLEFYQGVLDFERLSDQEFLGDAHDSLLGLFGTRRRVCLLGLGSERLELTEYLVPRGRPIPQGSRSNDRWFQHIAIVVSDIDRAYARLREHRVAHASTGPQRLPDWNRAAAGIEAFYFHDPDGHVLEIIRFPPDKGRPRWQAPGDRLFLGIDHTAIVAADTEASLPFYRDLLGLEVVGTSENFGPEQEHLNHVAGARLRITTLRAAGPPDQAGPGIELLEYLAPRDGRAAPIDSRPNDLWHWHTIVEVADAAAAADLLRRAGAPLVSDAIATFDADPIGLGIAVMFRDPDGHAVIVGQRRRVAGP